MRTLGKICGALGLLVLVSAPVTLLITTGSIWYAAGKAMVGVLLLAVFAGTHLGKSAAPAAATSSDGPRPMAQSTRAGFFYTSTALYVAVVLIALGAVNFIAAKRNKTWDLTQKKIYTLAPQTSQTLKELKEPVKAIGFLPASHPAYDPLESLLKRYATESASFTYELKDPLKNPDLAQRYQLKEGQTTVVLSRGSGPSEAHTALNVISEQDLTNALIKINTVGELKVYFLLGHGEFGLDAPGGYEPDAERGLSTVSEMKKSLMQEGYAPAGLNLIEARGEIPKDASLLIVAGARSRLKELEVTAIDQYLAQGGRLLYFADSRAETGLEPLLARYGIDVDPGLLADPQLSPGSPYMIISPFFADHEITSLLKELKMNVQLPTARGLSVVRQGALDGVTTTPIVTTSPYAWEESTPNESPALNSGEKAGSIPVVAVSTRSTASNEKRRFDEARVCVFGDADLLVDAAFGDEPNRNLVMNAVAWGSAQSKKITIRPPDRDISTIDIDERTMSRIRFLSMDLLPLTLIGLGLAIWMARRSR